VTGARGRDPRQRGEPHYPKGQGPISGGIGAQSIVTSDVQQLYADPAAAAAQAVDKIAAARVWLLKEKPFFGVLARALQVEATLKVPAFRLTPDDRLLANALAVLEMRFPSLCARLAHLCLHAALGAFVRRGAREPLRWNVAHDLAIDPLLRAAGFNLGASLSSADLPPGASAEEYFALLPEDAKPDDLWCDLSEPPPPPDAPPAGNFTRQDDDQGSDPGSHGDQQGKDPKPAEGEPEDDDEDDDEEDDDEEEEPSPLEARARELQWKMRLAAALEEELASGGKTFGETPAWIDELVQATIEPPPDWTAALQQSISMLTRTGRSFLRPSRRMSALVGPDGAWPEVVAMPGRRILPAGKLVSVIDTSASIEAATLRRFLGALCAIATSEGFDEIRLLQADAEVTKDETVFAAELLFHEVAIVGRGGTDFGPALRKLAEESRREGERYTVVYLTDLDGRFPKAVETRPLEVLWVVPGKAAKPPPFGRLLEMALAARR
jgi:predicted metal-dependent peptidase